ncbi:MAG: hypothetical protein A2902_03670 [Elusimicrobia bacterium RIFCSPLOWO2_01_FULL_64_13]|nr:MAG: hypothetical protein A2902_03670 [Elusimicrobia bacterium RIFCSPLOWO2_01_FULL_64_13]
MAKGRLVIGVCNGFQALVKAGFLPGEGQGPAQTASLTDNDSGRFQCEWTGIRREDSRAEWLSGLPRSFELPIAHGEGRFVARDAGHLRSLFRKGQVVFRYHPKNPNGSQGSIAGICNEGGNVVGLMPHPERYVNAFQHPAWTSIKSRHTTGGQAPGHLFWKSAADYAKGLS